MHDQQIRVLIVEDEEDHAVLVQALVKEGLRESQMTFEHVRTGSDALHRLESNVYDICLLDYQLADKVDGLQVLEDAQAKGIDTPIVMMTSMGSESVAVQAMKAGAKDYIRKETLSPDLLRASVHHTLALHHQETLRKHAQEALEKANKELAGKVEELDKANKELVRLGRLRDEFIRNISHELRTPIANLKLSLQLLIAHPEGRERYLITLRREVERLHFIIEELLNVARTATEQPSFIRESLDPNTLALLLVADRAMLAQERGLDLTFTEHPYLPKIQVDRNQLERALSILLINALNYTTPGGRIEVATHEREIDGHQWVGFSVKDTGPGISSEEREHVFEQFYRGKAALQSGVPGTGLGLAIARGIVEQHDGSIEVDSEDIPGKGAVFSIWLLAADQGNGEDLD